MKNDKLERLKDLLKQTDSVLRWMSYYEKQYGIEHCLREARTRLQKARVEICNEAKRINNSEGK